MEPPTQPIVTKKWLEDKIDTLKSIRNVLQTQPQTLEQLQQVCTALLGEIILIRLDELTKIKRALQ